MAEIKINMDSLKTFRKTVRHKVQDGSNIFRFLPPFGEGSNGYPYQKWAVVWGLQDPSTGNRRPYASPSTYEGKCPIFEYLDVLRPKVEALQGEMAASGASKDEIKERFAATNKFISDLRPKTVFAYNAASKAGEVGILELKSTAHKKLLTLMNQYIIDYNQDPTSLGAEATDSGVWFDVKRAGAGLQTEYDAVKHQSKKKDASGVPTFVDDRESLPENVMEDYDNLAYDLGNIYQKKSYDEMREILLLNLQEAIQANPDLAIEGFFEATDSSVKEEQQADKSADVKVDTDTEALLKEAEDIFA